MNLSLFRNSSRLPLYAVLIAVIAALKPAAGEPAPIRVAQLAAGGTVTYPVVLLQGQADFPDGQELLVVNTARLDAPRILRTHVWNGKFKALVELYPGLNTLNLSAGASGTDLQLSFQPRAHPHLVRFYYFTDNTGRTEYQSERAHDPQDFAAKLDTAAKLIQTFYAERMFAAGWGRETFDLELNDRGRVVVHELRGAKPAADYYKLDGEGLYSEIFRELQRRPASPGVKNVAVMAFTRFDPETRKVLGHTALGGGDLGVFGSAGMFAWPSSLQGVESAFTDTTRVDPARTHDDSNGRGAYWGLASTTLGAVIHEMGHTFGLPHTSDRYDVMSRGFDYTNRFFTLVEPPSVRSAQPYPFRENEVAYLDPVNAARLAYHPWFQGSFPPRDAPRPTVRVYPARGKAVVEAAAGCCVIGLDAEGLSVWNDVYRDLPPQRKEYDLSELARLAPGKNRRLLVIDSNGNQAEANLPDATAPN